MTTHRVRLALLVTAAAVLLALAGVAAAAALRSTITVLPGKCVTIHSTRVCAAKAKPQANVVTSTVTNTVTDTVTTTVQAPASAALPTLEGSNVHDIMHTVFPGLVTWWNQFTAGVSGTASTYQSGGYWSFTFTCFSCGNN